MFLGMTGGFNEQQFNKDIMGFYRDMIEIEWDLM